MCEPDEGWMAGLSAEGRKTADMVALRYTRWDLVYIVSAWADSVRAIAEDYGEDHYDDYYIYVSWREILDEIIAALPDADASEVRKAVEPADIQFKNHTFDDGGQAMSRKYRIRTDRWYWRRVPAHGPIARSLGIV